MHNLADFAVFLPLTHTDIDECEPAGTSMCDHECVNTLGSYRCRCHRGYILAPDKHSCIPVHKCESIYLDESLGEDSRTPGLQWEGPADRGRVTCVPVRSTGKSDTSTSAGTCSVTCQDFVNMKSSLLQLKLKLGNMHSSNQVAC